METVERSFSRWHVGLAVGALSISASAVLLGLAGTTPATASVTRSALALAVAAVLAISERRRAGGLERREYLSATLCGAFFAGDMLWWTQAIPEVGAGLSTVLVNTQVAIVPLLAWLIDHERTGPRFLWSLPAMLTGVVLAGGLFEHGEPTRRGAPYTRWRRPFVTPDSCSCFVAVDRRAGPSRRTASCWHRRR
jgi:drug/metabolite transporter (DMT)-like permease